MKDDPRISVLRHQIEEAARLTSSSTELAMSILGDQNGLRLEVFSLRVRLVQALTELQNTLQHLETSRNHLKIMATELESLKGIS